MLPLQIPGVNMKWLIKGSRVVARHQNELQNNDQEKDGDAAENEGLTIR
jgi:hypothetical protein